jgi:hypothetical protein
LTGYERQNRRFSRLKLLVAQALKLGKDPASSRAALSSINDNVLAEVQKCKDSKAEMLEDISSLRRKLRIRMREQKQDEGDVEDFRTEYQRRHRDMYIAKMAVDARKRAQATANAEPSEYTDAEKYLTHKIEGVKEDIRRLKWQPVGATAL